MSLKHVTSHCVIFYKQKEGEVVAIFGLEYSNLRRPCLMNLDGCWVMGRRLQLIGIPGYEVKRVFVLMLMITVDQELRRLANISVLILKSGTRSVLGWLLIVQMLRKF